MMGPEPLKFTRLEKDFLQRLQDVGRLDIGIKHFPRRGPMFRFGRSSIQNKVTMES